MVGCGVGGHGRGAMKSNNNTNPDNQPHQNPSPARAKPKPRPLAGRAQCDPLDYNSHPYPSMRLVHEFCKCDPLTITEERLRDYILHVKTMPFAASTGLRTCNQATRRSQIHSRHHRTGHTNHRPPRVAAAPDSSAANTKRIRERQTSLRACSTKGRSRSLRYRYDFAAPFIVRPS
jgi:hypothetical protein